MVITSDIQKQILEKYSQDESLNQISSLSEKEKEEIMLVLGGEGFLQKKEKMVRDKKIIKHLCKTKLQTLLLLEKQAQNPIEKIDNSKYKQQYTIFKENYLDNLYHGEKLGEIVISRHVFDHVESNISKYKSGSLSEKIKHARGVSPNFISKYWHQTEEINEKYLMLDPEKIDIAIVDFLRTGNDEKRKYTPAEEIELKQWLLNNNELCSHFLLSYQPLIIPENFGYSEKTTDRIVTLGSGKNRLGYLVSENIPIRYTQSHLRKYRGNEFSFQIFATKENLVAYLKNQLFFIKKQRERFQETITYFTALDSNAENKDNIENAYLGFSTHGTFTDQVLTEKLDELLSDEKRGRKQIIDAIIEQAKKGIKETETKEAIMWTHYNAVTDNSLF